MTTTWNFKRPKRAMFNMGGGVAQPRPVYRPGIDPKPTRSVKPSDNPGLTDETKEDTTTP